MIVKVKVMSLVIMVVVLILWCLVFFLWFGFERKLEFLFKVSIIKRLGVVIFVFEV